MKPVDQAIKIVLGPCIDDTDFKSREEALTYDQAGMEIDVILEKPDGTITTTALTPTTAGVYDWAHLDQGYYDLELPASGGVSYNNDTEGILHVVGYCTGVLPFRSPSYDIVPEKVYASLVAGSDNLEVDATLVEGADATDTIQASADAALVANNLDHLAKTATASADMTTEVADNTIISRALANGDTSAFDPSTDGLQPIRDTAPLGTAMRGTDNAALATVCTEARLAELDAANIPAGVDTIAGDVAGLDGAAMRGTDGANTTMPDAAGTAATLHAATNGLITTVDGVVDAIATVLSGITSLAHWLRAIVRKDAADATAKSEINSGGGAYHESTDSQEGIRDTAPLGTAMRGTDGAYTGTPPTAGAIADQIWDETLADHDGVGSTGEALTGADAPSAADVADAVWDEAIADHVAADTTGEKLDDLPLSGTGDWTDAEKAQVRHRLGIDGTATEPSSGDPSLAPRGADSDTLETLSDQIDAIAAVAATLTSPTVTTTSKDYTSGQEIVRGGRWPAADDSLSVALVKASGWPVGSDSWTWQLLFSLKQKGGTVDLALTADTATISGTTMTLAFHATAAQTALLSGTGRVEFKVELKSTDGSGVISYYDSVEGTASVRDPAGEG